MTFLTHLSEGTLSRLADGTLPEAEAATARAHTGDCERCASRLARLESVVGALALLAERPEPPADFLASVMARVDREVLPALAPQRRWRAALGAIGVGAAATVAGALLSWHGAAPPVASAVADVVTFGGKVLAYRGPIEALLEATAPAIAIATGVAGLLLTPVLVRATRLLQPVPVRARARA